jgi:subfamily B ATP-binding cassette protein HlyB/CyaB
MQRRTSNTATRTIDPAGFAWALKSVAELLRIPHDARLAAQAFPPPHDLAGLMGALDALGVRCAARPLRGAALAEAPLPLLALRAGTPARSAATDAPAPAASGAGSSTGAPAEPTLSPVLVVQAAGAQLRLLEPGRTEVRTLTTAAFDAAHLREVVLLARRGEDDAASDAAPDAASADGSAAAQERFGFAWFVPHLLRHKAVWRDVLLASVVMQLIALALPLTTQVVIDKVVVHQTLSTLWVIAFALAVFVIFNAALSWARQYLVLHTGNRIDALLGSRVFAHLLRLPVGYFEQRPTGALVARLHGVETIREFITGAAVTLVLDVPCMLIFLAVMFFYSWQLSLIALGFVLVTALLSLAVTPSLRARLNEQFLQGARNQAFLTEYVAGIDTVKSLQMEPQLGARYGELIAAYLKRSFRTRNLANAYGTATQTLEQAQTAAILVVGALLVMAGEGFTIGMLVAFQMFAARVSQPLLKLAGLYQEFQNAHVAVQRLGDLMNAPPEPHSLGPRRDGQGAGRIDVAGLAFRYGREHPYLYRGLDLRFEAGQTTALTGPSGSGKSTLARLIQGFYPPAEGRILIDGGDIAHLSANELRCLLGVVPQETVLYAGTVFDNLRLAAPAASFDEVVAACQVAEIHATIEALPAGYQTLLGEQGVGLSGGQRQRIAIARALLKTPRILIFDEATSHLDDDTAERFAATINRLRGKVTLIFIAHHLPRGLIVDRTLRLAGPCSAAPEAGG